MDNHRWFSSFIPTGLLLMVPAEANKALTAGFGGILLYSSGIGKGWRNSWRRVGTGTIKNLQVNRAKSTDASAGLRTVSNLFMADFKSPENQSEGVYVWKKTIKPRPLTLVHG